MSSIVIPALRILVVDDHALYRRGLAALLAHDPQISVVGDAADAGQALQQTHDLKPDVILLDQNMPGVNGIQAIPSLLAAAPRAHILMLTISEDQSDLHAAMEAGASGYLLKSMKCTDLIAAVHRVFANERVIAPEMTELQAIALSTVASGISLKEIS